MSPRLLLTSRALALALALNCAAAPLLAHDPARVVHPAPISAPISQEPERDLTPLLLMGTIPIYWGEDEDAFAAQISGDVEPHWARAQLEQDYSLVPLDYLNPDTLGGVRVMLMAQPRGLTAEENVALDNWVRGGGRLLLLADPVMTGHSHYGLGDRRRPQDTALLSPILSHWGLDLLFDADQPQGLQMREYAGGDESGGDSISIPVNLPGHFAGRDSDADCRLYATETLAFCRIGAGFVTILADAALLDHEGPWPGSRQAFDSLLGTAFGSRRELAGDSPSDRLDGPQNIESYLENPLQAAVTPAQTDPP